LSELSPCATVLRSTFRPTRAIQIWFSKMGTRTSWDYCGRFRAGFLAVSRRCHPVTLALAGTSTAKQLRAEPLARRRRRRSILVPRPSAPRQESLRPSCGETGWCPNSGAPSANAPLPCGNRVVALAQRRTRRRPMASAILTTHGHVRRFQRPDCATLRPRLSPP